MLVLQLRSAPQLNVLDLLDSPWDALPFLGGGLMGDVGGAREEEGGGTVVGM